MAQDILIALRNLAQHKRRTFLLGGAISGVTMLLVLMFGLFTGIQEAVLESATTLSTGHVNVAGFFKVTAGASSPVVTQYSKVIEVIEKNVPELEYIAPRSRGWARLISETGAMQAGLAGVDLKHELGLRRVLQITRGSLDDLEKPNTALIFEEQAKKMGISVGDAITISAPTFRGTNNTIDVRVVAVAKNVGLLSTFNIFVPNQTIRDLYQLGDDTTGALHLYLNDLSKISSVEERLRKALAEAGYPMMDKDPRAYWFKFDVVNREAWTGQKLDVTNWEDEVSFLKWTITAISVLGNALIFILLVIIAVGVMNTLWIAIRERTREIGTLRAIGMQRRRVLSMFLTEAFLLSFLSTLFGSALGIIACSILNAMSVSVPESVQLFLMRDRLLLSVHPASIVLAISLIVVCTTLVSLIPSFLAARLKPITAMSQVG